MSLCSFQLPVIMQSQSSLQGFGDREWPYLKMSYYCSESIWDWHIPAYRDWVLYCHVIVSSYWLIFCLSCWVDSLPNSYHRLYLASSQVVIQLTDSIQTFMTWHLHSLVCSVQSATKKNIGLDSSYWYSFSFGCGYYFGVV